MPEIRKCKECKSVNGTLKNTGGHSVQSNYDARVNQISHKR